MILDTTARYSSAYTGSGNPVGNEEPLKIVMVPWKNHGLGALSVNLAFFSPTSARSERKIPARTKLEPQRRVLYPAVESIHCLNRNYKNYLFLLAQQALGKHVAQ